MLFAALAIISLYLARDLVGPVLFSSSIWAQLAIVSQNIVVRTIRSILRLTAFSILLYTKFETVSGRPPPGGGGGGGGGGAF